MWAKREDCNSGLAFGGNKTRKLEYLVADALAKGCDTLVSIGGVQSNHTRQVAAAAARTGHGLRARAGELGRLARRRLRPRRQHPAQPPHGRRRAARATRASGSASRRAGSRRSPTSRRPAASRTRSPPARPTIRSAGSASRAGRRRSPSRRRELGVFFDTIVVCSVTGSTQAGMIAGFAGQERARRVIGIDGSAKPEETLAQVARIARATAALIEVGRELRDDEIVLDDRYHAGIYGIPDEHDARGDADRRPARGDDHRPRLRGEVDGGADRPRRAAARSSAARPCCTPTSAASPPSTPTRRWCDDDRGRAAVRRRARRPRRRAAARAVAGDGDRPPRQPGAPEPLGREGRRPPGLERVDGVAHDRAVVRVPRGARPRLGQAARLAGAARDQLPARPPRAALPDDAARVRRAAVLPVAREGPRPGRLLDGLGRDRRDGADLGRARAPLRRRALRRARSAAARSRCSATPSSTRARAGRRSSTRWCRGSARCCGSSTSTASRSTASCPTSRRAGSASMFEAAGWHT